jgi:hypothetical protein
VGGLSVSRFGCITPRYERLHALDRRLIGWHGRSETRDQETIFASIWLRNPNRPNCRHSLSLYIYIYIYINGAWDGLVVPGSIPGGVWTF